MKPCSPQFNAFIFFILLLVAGIAFAGDYEAKVLRVIDGDTFKAELEIWPGLYQRASVRIIGVDAPESRRGAKNGQAIPECEIELGLASKAFAESILKNRTVILKETRFDKYGGRIGSKVFINGLDVSILIIQAGHGIPYKGGKRQIWNC